MAMTRKNQKHSESIKNAAKNLPAKTKVAAGSIQDAANDSTKAVGKDIKQGFHDVSKNAHHAVNDVADKFKK